MTGSAGTLSNSQTEFSSRTILRVLSNGEKMLLGTSCEESLISSGAHVPLTAKRALIDRLIAAYGHETLLILGEGVKKLLHEPSVAVLVHQSDPKTLLLRWQRLEKYVHSRHVIELKWQAKRSVALRHVAQAGTTQPSLAEDLVVLGVILALLNVLGARGITLKDERNNRLVFDYESKNVFIDPTEPRPDWWIIEWTEMSDGISLIDPVNTNTIRRFFPDWPECAVDTAHAIVNTSVLTPRLANVARQLNMSQRTLQRRLTEVNLPFSKILAETRVRMAASWLINSELSIAEIGFISGFSDQPHFTRTFKSLVGMSPRSYHKFVS